MYMYKYTHLHVYTYSQIVIIADNNFLRWIPVRTTVINTPPNSTSGASQLGVYTCLYQDWYNTASEAPGIKLLTLVIGLTSRWKAVYFRYNFKCIWTGLIEIFKNLNFFTYSPTQFPRILLNPVENFGRK